MNGDGNQGDSKKSMKGIRFPWIHKREALDFHSAKICPRKNHSAVPPW